MTKVIENLKWKILRGWGILFRGLFISFVGIVGYFWIDPQAIGNLPFSKLTLNLVFSNLIAGFITIGCVIWFLKFPNEENSMSEDPNDNPYVFWGRLSFLIALLASIVSFFYVAWLM